MFFRDPILMMTMANAICKRNSLSAGALAILILLPIGLLWELRSNVGGLETGEVIPSFSVESMKGEKRSFDECSGEPRALFFLAEGCPHCERMLEAIQIIDTMFQSSLKVICIVLSGKDSLSAAYAAMRDRVTMRFADRMEARAKLNVLIVPTVLLLDGHGIVRAVESGERSAGYLAKLCSRLVAGHEGGPSS